MSNSKSLVFLLWITDFPTWKVTQGKVTRLASGEAVLMIFRPTPSRYIMAHVLGNQNRERGIPSTFLSQSSRLWVSLPQAVWFRTDEREVKSWLTLIPPSIEDGSVLRKQMTKGSVTLSSHNCHSLSWQNKEVCVRQFSDPKSQYQGKKKLCFEVR